MSVVCLRATNGSLIINLIERISEIFPSSSLYFYRDSVQIHVTNTGNSVTAHVNLPVADIISGGGSYRINQTGSRADVFEIGLDFMKINKAMKGSVPDKSMLEIAVMADPVKFVMTGSKGGERSTYSFPILDCERCPYMEYEDNSAEHEIEMESATLKNYATAFSRVKCENVTIRYFEHGIQFSTAQGSSHERICDLTLERIVGEGGDEGEEDEDRGGRSGAAAGGGGDKGECHFEGTVSLEHLMAVSKCAEMSKGVTIRFNREKYTTRRAGDGTLEEVRQPMNIEIKYNIPIGVVAFILTARRPQEDDQTEDD